MNHVNNILSNTVIRCHIIHNIYKDCIEKTNNISNNNECYYIKNEYKKCMQEFNISK